MEDKEQTCKYCGKLIPTKGNREHEVECKKTAEIRVKDVVEVIGEDPIGVELAPDDAKFPAVFVIAPTARGIVCRRSTDGPVPKWDVGFNVSSGTSLLVRIPQDRLVIHDRGESAVFFQYQVGKGGMFGF